MVGASSLLILSVLCLCRKKIFFCCHTDSGHNFGPSQRFSGGGSSDKEMELKRFQRMADGNASAYPKASTDDYEGQSLYGHQRRDML